MVSTLVERLLENPELKEIYLIEKHLDNLIRHLELVREYTLLLGKKLLSQGRKEFAIELICRGQFHDKGKFFGLQWEYLHKTNIPKDKLELAVKEHQKNHDHHPEYWQSINNMPEICIAEMVCDWYARSSEFGTDLRVWISNIAQSRYSINKQVKEKIDEFVNLLLEDTFVR